MTDRTFAAHTDGLVLGLGATEQKAIDDARRHLAEEDLLDIARIETDAADYVRNGGDCRGLTLGPDDVFRLRQAAPPRRQFRG